MIYRDDTERWVERIAALEAQVAALEAARDARDARDRVLASSIDAFGATAVMRLERTVDRALGPSDLEQIGALASKLLGPAKITQRGARLRWWWVRDERRSVELTFVTEGASTRLSLVERHVGASTAFNGLTGVSLAVLAVLLVVVGSLSGDASVACVLFVAWLLLAYVAFRARRLAVARVRHRELETILETICFSLSQLRIVVRTTSSIVSSSQPSSSIGTLRRGVT